MTQSLNRAGRPHEGRTLTLEMRTLATPQQVWEAWADPVKLSQWFTDSARGEATPGSTMYWIFEKFGYEIPYEVVDAIPGKLLALGGKLPDRPPFLLEISIEREGDEAGETVLRLVNSGFLGGEARWEEEYEGVSSGWAMALALLRYYLERHFGEPKRSFLLIEPASTPPGEMLAWYTDPERLAEWLADDASAVRAPAAIGDTVRIPLAEDGRVIEGETLAVTRREVAFSWDREDVVLELKAFMRGPSPVVSVRGTAWRPDEWRFGEIERTMGVALKRLAARLAERPLGQAATTK